MKALMAVAVRVHWSNADDAIRHRILAVADRLPLPADHPARIALLALVDPETRGAEALNVIARHAIAPGDDPGVLRLLGSAATAIGAFDLAPAFLTGAVAGLRRKDGWGCSRRRRSPWRGRRSTPARCASGCRLPRRPPASRTRPVSRAGALSPSSRTPRSRGYAATRSGPRRSSPQPKRRSSPWAPTRCSRWRPWPAARPRSRPAATRTPSTSSAGCSTRTTPRTCRTSGPGGWPTSSTRRCTPAASTRSVAIVATLEPIARRSRYAAARPSRSTSRARCSPTTRTRARSTRPAWTATSRPGRSCARECCLPMARGCAAAAGSPSRVRRCARPARRSRRWRSRRGPSAPARSCARRARRRGGESPDARDELTPQEVQIAEMAADGLTNREIGQRLYLSHRTVGSHLYRIFPKLGVSSRAELGRALRPPPGAPVT